jgi:hypothetical protein
MKRELYVTADGAISLYQDSGENVELRVLFPDQAHRMVVGSGTSTYVGRVLMPVMGGGIPRTAERVRR